MASPLKQYLDRSVGMLRRNTAKVMRMDVGSRPPPLPILSFTSAHPPVTPISSLALGSDADIGGLSTARLTPIPAVPDTGDITAGPSAGDPPTSSSEGHAAFHGTLSLAVPPAYASKIRTGYAAFRTKTRPTLFGEETWDLSVYSHLRVVVGYRGWEAWRDKWVVNIQTDGPVRSDLFQHRLPLPSSSSSSSPSSSSRQPLDPLSTPYPHFATLHLPLASFVLTNSGQTAAHQIPMMRTKVRTIGFALLGGGRTAEEAPPASSSSSGDRSDQERSMGLGGWRGRGASGLGSSSSGSQTGGGEEGEMEVDAELEELMRSDRPAAAPQSSAPRMSSANRTLSAGGNAAGGGGGYHRVGSRSVPAQDSEVLPDMTEGDVRVGSEVDAQSMDGYYELCIRSVDAVSWDPETDDGDEAQDHA